MLGHTVAYLVVIAISLVTAYAMGKPAQEHQDEAPEIREYQEPKEPGEERED